MRDKVRISLTCSLGAVFFVLFLSACTPKKMAPSDDVVLHESTKAAAQAEEDEDEDGMWEADEENEADMSVAQRLAKGYRNAPTSVRYNKGKATGSTATLLGKAQTALGTPYVSGGTSRSGGFDCSGFVQWSYNHVGIQLPRTAREQSQVGRAIRNPNDMKAGDIVAFRHPKRGYHTGIYVGDGKFIHSPRKRNVVRINSLDDPYFSKTFFAARRLNVSNEGDIEAAEQVLAAYAANPARKAPKEYKINSRKNGRASLSGKKSISVTVVSQQNSRKRRAEAREEARKERLIAQNNVSEKRQVLDARSRDKDDKPARTSKTKETKRDKETARSERSRKADNKDKARSSRDKDRKKSVASKNANDDDKKSSAQKSKTRSKDSDTKKDKDRKKESSNKKDKDNKKSDKNKKSDSKKGS